MKCVSIVYRRPTSQSLTPELVPVRSVKRSVDDYLEKLQQKQQKHKLMLQTQTKLIRSQIKSMQTSRPTRIVQQEMPDFFNVSRMKYSNQNIFKQQTNPEFSQEKKQKKFRSTFVKRKQSQVSYSLKGIKTSNHRLFDQERVKISPNRIFTGNQNSSKLLNLKKLKLTKPNTVLISIDFILNQNNFWQEERIDQLAHKNWKLLQQHSNIVWLTKRQNSSKKLQKYASQNGLRLDGVYKIMPSKKGQTLVVSLGIFEKDFRIQSEMLKMKDLKQQVIFINSLKVDQIKNVKYEEFYNSFPTAKSLRCVVHFIQVDMGDKHRFNSPLKILSKQNLPSPNSITHLFCQFFKENQTNPQQMLQSYMMDLNSLEPQEEETISKEEMMAKYEQVKEKFVNYFGNHLKISMNKKIKIEDTECSVQFMIGDMLKRNFNIMYGYNRQCIKIKKKMEKIQQKASYPQKIQPRNQEFSESKVFLKSHTFSKKGYEQLIKFKLKDQPDHRQNFFPRKRQSQKNIFYKDPVFLWKK